MAQTSRTRHTSLHTKHIINTHTQVAIILTNERMNAAPINNKHAVGVNVSGFFFLPPVGFSVVESCMQMKLT